MGEGRRSAHDLRRDRRPPRRVRPRRRRRRRARRDRGSPRHVRASRTPRGGLAPSRRDRPGHPRRGARAFGRP
ncbi:MAG: hypothetical protein M0R75_14170 [Dehalococcoidia bacterium]|nr:hypothetical protein [Dehalococcoidia bacterium]